MAKYNSCFYSSHFATAAMHCVGGAADAWVSISINFGSKHCALKIDRLSRNFVRTGVRALVYENLLGSSGDRQTRHDVHVH